jgi:hypothetical protein
LPRIGHTTQALVVRTDFSDEECWRAVCEQMLAETDEGFRAYIDIVEDPAFDRADTEELLSSIGDDYGYGFLIVADRVTITDPEHRCSSSISSASAGDRFARYPG